MVMSMSTELKDLQKHNLSINGLSKKSAWQIQIKYDRSKVCAHAAAPAESAEVRPNQSHLTVHTILTSPHGK